MPSTKAHITAAPRIWWDCLRCGSKKLLLRLKAISDQRAGFLSERMSDFPDQNIRYPDWYKGFCTSVADHGRSRCCKGLWTAWQVLLRPVAQCHRVADWKQNGVASAVGTAWWLVRGRLGVGVSANLGESDFRSNVQTWSTSPVFLRSCTNHADHIWGRTELGAEAWSWVSENLVESRMPGLARVSIVCRNRWIFLASFTSPIPS